MTKLKFIISISILLFFTTSCSNDDTIVTTPQPESTFKLKSLNNGNGVYTASYFSDGKLEAIFKPDNSFVNIIYNEAGHLSEYQGTLYEYDLQNRLIKIVFSGSFNITAFKNISYDASGRILKEDITIPEDYYYPMSPIEKQELTYYYNDLNQLTEIIETKDSSNTIVKNELSYNSLNQLTRHKELYTTDNGTTFKISKQVDLLYDNSKNPFCLMQKSIGLDTHFTFTAITYFYAHPPIAYLYFGFHSPLYYTPENNIKNIHLKEYDSNGNISYQWSQSVNYILEGEYPVTAKSNITLNNGATFLSDYSWEYFTD